MTKANSSKKVFCAMSGGVDSSVGANLLLEAGYQVTGVYMKNWSGDNYGIQSDCPWEQDQADVERVCKHIGIPFRSFNFEQYYRQQVVDYFFREYERGRTPNPDIMCNREIKFGHFLEKSLAKGAELIATGHYAQVKSDGDKAHLLMGADTHKDQTYFLSRITQRQLQHTLFPIGHLPKSEVRQLARQYDLHVASKPDSQGICFIGEINVVEFLRARLPKQPGEIRDIDTQRQVGEHDGAHFYTVGQRKGLGIGGQKKPYFVVDTDTDANIVWVGHGHGHPQLMRRLVTLEELHSILEETDEQWLARRELSASVRYNHQPQRGKLSRSGEGAWVFEFAEPQWAVTPGQTLAIYQGQECLGGGTIGG